MQRRECAQLYLNYIPAKRGACLHGLNETPFPADLYYYIEVCLFVPYYYTQYTVAQIREGGPGELE
jgi:hypothetical protein